MLKATALSVGRSEPRLASARARILTAALLGTSAPSPSRCNRNITSREPFQSQSHPLHPQRYRSES